MGDRVTWQSVKWGDGSRYEGLVKKDVCHLRGVFTYANGDRYMGEYVNNEMDGYGVYIWSDGTLYRGQWKNSTMNGCGAKITKQPNGHLISEEGEFINDEWAGNLMACTVKQAREAAAEADIAAQMARVFELHPDASDAAKQNKAAALDAGNSNVRKHLNKKQQQVLDKHRAVQRPIEIRQASPMDGPNNKSNNTGSNKSKNPVLNVVGALGQKIQTGMNDFNQQRVKPVQEGVGQFFSSLQQRLPNFKPQTS